MGRTARCATRTSCAKAALEQQAGKDLYAHWSTPGFKIEDAGGGKIAFRQLNQGSGNKYCFDKGSDGVTCTSNNIAAWEKFAVEDGGNDKVVLKGGKDNKYCVDDGTAGVKCTSNQIAGWEKFTVVMYNKTTADESVWASSTIQTKLDTAVTNYAGAWYGMSRTLSSGSTYTGPTDNSDLTWCSSASGMQYETAQADAPAEVKIGSVTYGITGFTARRYGITTITNQDGKWVKICSVWGTACVPGSGFLNGGQCASKSSIVGCAHESNNNGAWQSSCANAPFELPLA